MCVQLLFLQLCSMWVCCCIWKQCTKVLSIFVVLTNIKGLVLSHFATWQWKPYVSWTGGSITASTPCQRWSGGLVLEPDTYLQDRSSKTIYPQIWCEKITNRDVFEQHTYIWSTGLKYLCLVGNIGMGVSSVVLSPCSSGNTKHGLTMAKHHNRTCCNMPYTYWQAVRHACGVGTNVFTLTLW